MDLAFIIGICAASLTTISFLPQVIKAWKTKQTSDLSLLMVVLLLLGVFLWLVYGLMLKQSPIILANSVTLVLAITLLGLKLKYS